ncbi:rod-binding protein [Litorisediminicola beolgyonensis]|uniref:Rod-binding protein n=1 Tax=Litorisediminicola beolgyonensis TaxID=1173614 RepID=A0ABW3ZGJ8_9RHOB
MLAASKIGTPREAFGGGAGEDAFASFILDAHAEALVSRRGFGLSEHIFRSLVEASDG